MKKLFSLLISAMMALCAFNMGRAGERASLTAALRAGQRGGARIRFAPRQIREANRRLRYTIKAQYPQAVGAQDTRLARLNQEIRNLIAGEVNGFKKDFQRPEERLGPAGSSFDSSYVVELASNDLVSIGFSITSFYEGAAHPQHYTRAFNYDLKSGKRLQLSDLFRPNSNYLSLVSDYAVKSLRKELGPEADSDWIQTGAGPKEENYKSWNMTPKGLQVTFDPYQVASYAEGEHIVVIPYNALKDAIDPDGPLARVRPGQR